MRFLTVWRLGEDLARDRRPPAQGFCHLPRDGYQCLMSCSWFDLCPSPDVNIHGQPLRPRCYSCITWNTRWGPPQPKTQFPWNVGRLNNSQFTTIAGGKTFSLQEKRLQSFLNYLPWIQPDRGTVRFSFPRFLFFRIPFVYWVNKKRYSKRRNLGNVMQHSPIRRLAWNNITSCTTGTVGSVEYYVLSFSAHDSHYVRF